MICPTSSKAGRVSGTVHESHRQGRRPIFVLRYAKAETIRLPPWLYHAPDVPCLVRKRAKAQPFLRPLGHSRALSRAAEGGLVIQC